jgi:hypothetical protein
MMNRDRLLDKVRWADNVVARVIGQQAVAYRPSGAGNPLEPAQAYLRIPAAFTHLGGSFKRPPGYEVGLCTGIYDASYTRPGDYLVVGDRSWFIAAQEAFFPNLCVESGRLVSFARVQSPSTPGAGSYAGITAATSVAITGYWPANVAELSNSGKGAAGLPTDTPTSSWSVLLPPIPSVTLRVSDVMADDMGRTGVVFAAELTRLGWRLGVKATTA